MLLIRTLCSRLRAFVHYSKGNKDPNSADAYRPISLLSTLGKILERCVGDSMWRHIKDNSILSDGQYGFHSKSIQNPLADLRAYRKRFLLTAIVVIEIKSSLRQYFVESS